MKLALASLPRSPAPQGQASIVLSDFHPMPLPHRTSQDDLVAWLKAAHVAARPGSLEPATVDGLFRRYACTSDRIGFRHHAIPDFGRTEGGLLFSPQSGSPPLSARMTAFKGAAEAVFQDWYADHPEVPDAMMHVTCTGYISPNAAQVLTSERGWSTEVFNVYHMGCYAAHPAIRLAAGLTQQGYDRVDIVHTEFCSLHVDAADHSPGALVIQSLFGDGAVSYSVSSADANTAGLEVLAQRDILLPNTSDLMAWTVSDTGFMMTLARTVPEHLVSSIAEHLNQLYQAAGQDFREKKPSSLFAIHPGGPRIVDAMQNALELTSAQVKASRAVLYDYGNVSSATLPLIWHRLLLDPSVPSGTLIPSIGAGPGLTLSLALLRKR